MISDLNERRLMSEATQAAGVQNPPSFWEDAIDIFVSPVGVFRRRQNDSFWKPFLFVVLAFSIIGIATFDTTMQPIMEAEFARRMAASTQKLTPEQAAASMGVVMKFAKFVFPVGIAFTIVV